MKHIGFLSFGHWTQSPQSQTRSASDALLQSIELAVAAEELGADGAYFRVHHFARQLSSPFPLVDFERRALQVHAESGRPLRRRVGTGAPPDAVAQTLGIQQAEQIRLYRAAWKEAGHARTPRVSVSRSIFALVDERDRMYFGRGAEEGDRSYAAEPDVLIPQLRMDEAIAEADTLLLTVPNQLGVDYNAHVIEAILKHVAPGLGWR